MEGLSFILRFRTDLRWIRRRPLNPSPGFRVGDLAQPWFLRKRKDFMNSRSTVGFDHPQFSADRFRFFRGPRDLLPRQFLLRSVSCQLDLVTIFSLFDK